MRGTGLADMGSGAGFFLSAGMKKAAPMWGGLQVWICAVAVGPTSVADVGVLALFFFDEILVFVADLRDGLA